MVLPPGLRAGVGDRALRAFRLPGLRWHCRASYVVAPPSRLPGAGAARWLREPGSHPLPDGVALLEVLADACEGARR